MSFVLVAEIVLRLLQVFGPQLVKWLDELLMDAALEMTYNPSRDPDWFRQNLAAWFEKARRKTWWFSRKRRAINLLERAALKRAPEIHRSAMSGGSVTPLIGAELVEMQAVLS